MNIKIFKDLKQYVITSAMTVADLEAVKKYRPEALKKKDADGNDIFAVSYVEGKPFISAIGVTFGGKSSDGGYAIITGVLPNDLKESEYGGYIADKVGAALTYINDFEDTIPAIAAEIAAERAALIGSIVEA